MGLHDLCIYNTSYGWKKSRESNCQFDFRPLKSRIALIYEHVSGVPHIVEKLSTRIITLVYASPQSKVCIKNYGLPKWQEFQFREFRNSRLGSPEINDIWVQPPWLITENTRRGRWWLPPSSSHGESYESMYAYGLFVQQKCSNYALINLLFGLCMFIWIIGSLVIHRNPHSLKTQMWVLKWKQWKKNKLKYIL